jgi:ELWxxDGT repeat protein
VFTATDTTSASATGTELWSSDGTAAGTTLLKDINPGAASSSPTGLVVAGDALFFVAAEPIHGRELWVSDGTAVGTTLANDTSPGTGSGASSAPFAIGAGRRVIVALADGGNGSGTEPWVSDGTPAGTARVRDLNPGGGGSSPAGFVLLADLVLFSADDGSAGIELWAAGLKELGASEAAPFGVNCKGALDPRITFSGAPALASPAFSVALTGAVASSPAALFLAAQRVDLQIAGCTIYPSLTPAISFAATTGGTGTAAVTMPIPSSTAFLGASFWFQWVTVDLGGPVLGVASLSNGLRIRIGRS